MGGKGGGKTTTSGTTYTSSLPKYAEPFYREIMEGSANTYLDRIENYPLYGETAEDGTFTPAPRIAGPSQQEQAARGARTDMFLNPDLSYKDFAASNLNAAGGIASGLENSRFGQEQADFYMNPYTEAVTDKATRAAEQRYEQDADTRRARAGGGRGGYREAVMDSFGQTQHAANLGDITGQFSFQGYQQAQEQFERDRQSQFGLMSGMTNLAGAATDIGGEEEAREYARIGQMEGAGQGIRADEQLLLDQQYKDFVDQRDWGVNNYQSWMNTLSGTPVSPNSQTTTSAPTPGLATQIAGAGLSSYGLASMMKS